MKVYCIAISHKSAKVQLLASESDLFIQLLSEGSVQEFLNSSFRPSLERTSPGDRQRLRDGEHDGLSGTIVTDKEYLLLTPAATSSTFPELKQQLIKYQDPHAADPLLRVQRDLDETKIVLHNTMKSLLGRQEKLEELVERSDALSSQSKMFYKQAKKTNSCCVSLF
ncbi:hypothetical protein BC829DRAFT_454124 [Chytridium lagenaria]|nr:hypothetical protein BC829DRAFT_454124 [Chytridium lagenaria]